MLELDPDPEVARAEMSGLIFYLAAFGYIDGEIDPRELAFIRSTIHRIVTHRLRAKDGAEPDAARVEAEESKFQALVETIEGEVVQLLNDSVVETESRHFFITCRLKQRCFEVFKAFSPDQQKELLATVDELVLADGLAHPAELKLRGELAELLRAEAPARPPPVPHPRARRVDVHERETPPVQGEVSPRFALFEHSWVRDARVLRRQVAADRRLVKKALAVLQQRRKLGRGKLRGRTSVDQLADEPPFLDGFVHCLPPRPDREYEVTVLGDLHGCYSCLKAALTQSRFLEKVAAWRREPDRHPEPHLVMLGDYVDRGRYGFNGVLRVALQLLTAAPGQVVMLRGNHELFFEQDGVVHSLIAAADSLEAARPLAPVSLLRDYRKLFDALPTALILGRMLMTHGGIPQDGVVKALYRDLTSLNEPVVRFQMLWSDPSLSDVIPRALQDPMVRFGFGRLQCQAFLQRLGCHTLLRGHGMVPLGFLRHFDDAGVLAMTLCSAGGQKNRDLPPISDYRIVRPMAMTIRIAGGLDGPMEIDAWPIDYEPFNTAELNGFYAEPEGAAVP